jgi:glycosyltransferase involved in cell wall biosynthesis
MRPIRVLHVVGSMKRGGIETWLMNLIRQVDRRRFRLDFVVSNRSPSPWEPEIRALGGRIHVCMAHSQPAKYAFNLAKILYTHGPYDIVHSHLHQLNGIVALVGALSGVKVRIVHSHFAISGKRSEGSVVASEKNHISRLLVRSFATGALACSASAGYALFGPDWERKANRRVLFCGLDLAPFHAKPNRDEIRASLGIPRHSVVVGHAGRFVAQKNHSFFIDVALQYARLEPRSQFLLLGDGPLFAETKSRAAASPFANRFHFAGPRDDVPTLMLAMDCFLFPSHFEGLPLVLIEAQAAGLPCVLSDVIAPETDVCPFLIRRMSLKQSPEKWADAIDNAATESTLEQRDAALCTLESSAFNIRSACSELERYYLQLCGISEPLDHAVAA